MDCIDMHIHTTRSDGICTPSEVVEWGNKLGLKGIAITDHDTVDGIEEAIEKAKILKKPCVVPGIEFSALYREKEVHILGYFLDYQNEELLRITNKIKMHRSYRGKEIINRLKELKIFVGDNLEIEEGNYSVGRPHIARALVDKGYVKTTQEAFEKYLKKGKPGYVDRFKLSIKESVDIIEAANGLPVLAHPGLIHKSLNVYEICRMGMKGLEVYHTQHSIDETCKYLSMAKKMDLLITGGTDFHDQFIDGVPALGNITVPFNSIKDYIDFL